MVQNVNGITLRLIETFFELAQAGSYGIAAARLGIGQPSLSRNLKQLENELGVALVQRHSKGVVLTEAGLRLSTMSHVFFETLRRLPKPGGKSERGDTLLVGIPLSIASVLTPAIYLNVRNHLPNIRIDFREMPDAELYQAVEAYRVDVALQYDPPKLDSILRDPILEEELLVIASPAWDWPSQDALTVADLALLPLVLPSLGQHERRKLSEVERKRGVRLEPLIESDNASTLTMFVNQGVGLSVVTAFSVYREIKAGFLQSRPFGKPTSTTRLCICMRRADRLQSSEVLVSTISEAVREVSRGCVGVTPISPLGHVLGG